MIEISLHRKGGGIYGSMQSIAHSHDNLSERNIYKKDTHHSPPQSSPPSTVSSGRGIGTALLLLSWIFGLKKEKRSVAISAINIFQQKEDQNPGHF